MKPTLSDLRKAYSWQDVLVTEISLRCGLQWWHGLTRPENVAVMIWRDDLGIVFRAVLPGGAMLSRIIRPRDLDDNHLESFIQDCVDFKDRLRKEEPARRRQIVAERDAQLAAAISEPFRYVYDRVMAWIRTALT